jgi:ferritin-like protein
MGQIGIHPYDSMLEALLASFERKTRFYHRNGRLPANHQNSAQTPPAPRSEHDGRLWHADSHRSFDQLAPDPIKPAPATTGTGTTEASKTIEKTSLKPQHFGQRGWQNTKTTRPPHQAKEHIMANEGYHEPVEELSDATRDMHKAIQSLMEELEAVDWYNQRVDACKDKELKAILAHNRDEEKEHAAMVLEWIRRKDPTFDKELKDFLFTDKPIAHE